MRIQQVLIFLLMCDAIAVTILLMNNVTPWPLIAIYWFLLTLKNTFDYEEEKTRAKDRKRKESP